MASKKSVSRSLYASRLKAEVVAAAIFPINLFPTRLIDGDNEHLILERSHLQFRLELASTVVVRGNETLQDGQQVRVQSGG